MFLVLYLILRFVSICPLRLGRLLWVGGQFENVSYVALRKLGRGKEEEAEERESLASSFPFCSIRDGFYGLGG